VSLNKSELQELRSFLARVEAEGAFNVKEAHRFLYLAEHMSEPDTLDAQIGRRLLLMVASLILHGAKNREAGVGRTA
jgi:hypothetical protein